MIDRPEKIKVAFFCDAPYTGGAEKYIFLLASHLDPARFESHVIINNDEGLKRLRSWLEDSGIKVSSLGYTPPFSPGNARKLYRILRKYPADIFHINLPGSYDAGYGLAAPVARLAGVGKVVSTEHLPMFPAFTKGMLLKSITSRSIDRVITVSEDNRRHLERNHHIPSDKIEVIYNGIDRAVPDGETIKAIQDDIFEVTIIGALHKRKGHLVLFEAIAKLPRGVRLTVAGEGEMEKEYREYVESAGIGDRVEFIGHSDDIMGLLSRTDLLAVPSTLEATPYVIIEAMSLGVPVVASDIFGIPELVSDGETGLLVDEGDSGRLAESVERLMSDRELLERMSKRSLEVFKERFTIERSVSLTSRLYEALVRGKEKTQEMR
ncbi:MAG: glycosyltransferase family 4 protein [Candidatus Krumholzibacteriota bacterium]|nr:glycosyltransferase family 4 protein [Candidatus Krumholzibacteriota bacterium]